MRTVRLGLEEAEKRDGARDRHITDSRHVIPDRIEQRVGALQTVAGRYDEVQFRAGDWHDVFNALQAIHRLIDQVVYVVTEKSKIGLDTNCVKSFGNIISNDRNKSGS